MPPSALAPDAPARVPAATPKAASTAAPHRIPARSRLLLRVTSPPKGAATHWIPPGLHHSRGAAASTWGDPIVAGREIPPSGDSMAEGAVIDGWRYGTAGQLG